MACKNQEKKQDKMTETEPQTMTKEMMESAVIYEANIRQYSPEGNFDAFTKDLPELKEKTWQLMNDYYLQHKS